MSCIGESGLRQLRERALQVRREVNIDAVTDPWTPHDMKEADVLLEVSPTEEPGAHFGAVVAPSFMGEHRRRSQERSQGVNGQRRAPVQKGEIHPGSLIGDEPPCGDAIRRRIGANAAAADHVVDFTRLGVDPLELDPEIANRIRLLPARKHPRAQHAGLLTGGVDAAHVRLEQEGQEHVHRCRLARSVHATEQQTSAGQLDRLVAVLVHVEDARSIETPPTEH